MTTQPLLCIIEITKEKGSKNNEKNTMTEQELREIKNRLDVLYSRVNELKMEMTEIADEIFNLELDILLRVQEK